MNSLKTVLFPATVIHSIRQYPLFLLFPQIHIIRPAESQTDNEAETSPDSFINSGLCQEDTPCPLGDDLARFLHLVSDIEQRKDDYASQLSSLTLAGMTSSKIDGEQSENAIINELLTPKDLSQEKEQQQLEEKLWQARLVLAIGEILDREEEEIAKNLSVLDDETSGLMNALKGEMDEFDDDSPFSELTQLKSNFNATHSGNIGSRLKSWATLFEKSDLTSAHFFITTSSDVLDILSESYDTASGKRPESYDGLELPGLIGWNEKEALEAIINFTATNAVLQTDLNTTLHKLLLEATLYQEKWQEIKESWNRELEQTFPTNKLGRSPVTVYLYKECDLIRLLGLTAETEDQGNLVVLHLKY